MSRGRWREEEDLHEGGENFGLSRSGSAERPRLSNPALAENNYGENHFQRIEFRGRVYSIRPSSEAALHDLARFRLIREEDLRGAIYGNKVALAKEDFESLSKQGLVNTIAMKPPGEGLINVRTLSEQGHALVRKHTQDKSTLYTWSPLKLSNLEHDSLLYRAYLRERQRLAECGGSIKRIILDAELKREHFKRTHQRGRSYEEQKLQSAKELHLPIIDEHVVFPDFRLEYETEHGEIGRADIEVATGNYRERHIGMKLQAGFRVYAQASSRLRVISGYTAPGRVYSRQERTLFVL